LVNKIILIEFSKIFFNFNRVRTRVFAQGFVVTLLTAGAIYHVVKDRQTPPHDHK
jgi:hypothetical protein